MRQNNMQNRPRNRGHNNKHRANVNRHNPNRAMESNGPEVRIRGNASHIADKYMQLARDAQSAGDAIRAENYLQHAEHYNRVIAFHQNQLNMQRARQANNQTNNQAPQQAAGPRAASTAEGAANNSTAEQNNETGSEK